MIAMARADLKRRLDEVAAAFGAAVVMGIWAHDDGTPTYHQLSAKGMSLERWFRTGNLPDPVQFVAVMHVAEAERLWRPGPERELWDLTPTDEQLHELWTPFPTLHPDTIKHFQKMLELPFYSFIGGQFLGMNGPLLPKEQRRELYPHG